MTVEHDAAAPTRPTVEERLAANRRKATLVEAAAAAAIVGLGLVVGLVAGFWWLGLLVGLLLGAGLALALRAQAEQAPLRGAEAVPATAERWPRYHNLAEGLCVTSGLAVPTLQVIPADGANAVATGRGPGRATITLTTGMLEGATRIELEGVLAQLLVQIRSGDVLVTGLDAALGSIPGLGFVRRRLVGAGERVLDADQDAVLLTRYPPGLLSALRKAEATGTEVPGARPASAAAWFADPTGSAASPPGHPDLAVRVDALAEL